MQKNADTRQYTVIQLEQKLLKDMQACATATERSCCKSFGGIEICKRAYSTVRTRPLTPDEVEIAKKYGYKPR